jgi:hypothetical protein
VTIRFPSAPALGVVAAMPPKLGKYEILERIAVGGMAEIYLARLSGISGFEKLVVVKRMLPQLAPRPEFVQMFLDEARIAATLHHSNIVQVFDVGAEDGQYYFAMEFLHGEDVSSFMHTLTTKGRVLPLEAALEIVLGVCAGLHFAHEQTGRDGAPLKIVHRDVSPQNVLVTFDGGVKLLDFGIAKATRRLAATRHGTLKGKVQYMSPEQCRGESVDRRSDIFSTAILLWELTTSHRLFARTSEFDTMKKIIESDAPPPSSMVREYPPALEQIVMRGLRRRRSERYQTAQEMQVALEEFVRENRLAVSAIALERLMHELFSEELHAFNAIRDSGTLSAFRGTGMLRRETRGDLEAEAEGPAGEDEADDLEAATDPAVDADGVRLTVPLRARDAPAAAAAPRPVALEPRGDDPTAPTAVVEVPPPASLGVVPANLFEAASARNPAAPRRRRWLVLGGLGVGAVLVLAISGWLVVRGLVRATEPPPIDPAALEGWARTLAADAAPASAPATAPATSPGTTVAAPAEPAPRARVRAASRPPKPRPTDGKSASARKKAPASGVNLDTALPP